MKTEIISIGTELLLGEITDTNASYLASQLPLLGLDLLWVTQVGDNMGRLQECLTRAWRRSDIVITTGGLGPTEDDLTRETIAALFDETPQIDPKLEQTLRGFFTSRKLQMPENNLKQGMLIPSAKSISNPIGSAPGWWVQKVRRGKQLHLLIAMPGPPTEMHRMWQSEVFGRLRDLLGGEVIVSKMIKTITLSESGVAEKVASLTASVNPSIGIYAKPDGIHLRLTAKAKSDGEAKAMISNFESKVRAIIGDIIWGSDEETLETIIGKLLSEKRLTLATMESCSGGLLASTITDVPGSSDYFKGGLVTYTNEAKISYGVKYDLIARYGAVSQQVAADMARAARAGLAAEIGIGITGVAGPATMEGKPAGTVFIAVDSGKEIRSIEGHYPPLRHQVKRRAVYHALFELRKMLLK